MDENTNKLYYHNKYVARQAIGERIKPGDVLTCFFISGDKLTLSKEEHDKNGSSVYFRTTVTLDKLHEYFKMIVPFKMFVSYLSAHVGTSVIPNSRSIYVWLDPDTDFECDKAYVFNETYKELVKIANSHNIAVLNAFPWDTSCMDYDFNDIDKYIHELNNNDDY